MNNIMTILTIFLVSSLAFLVLFSPNGKWAVMTQTKASVISEGNSTYLGSNASTNDDQDISRVIVIPNPQTASSNSTSNSTQNSSDTDKNESLNSVAEMNNKDNFSAVSPLTSEDDVQRQTESSKSSTTSNATQRGEYKVDDNGVHYYDINNCSLIKGSSGIGDLSECQDAERVIQKELAG